LIARDMLRTGDWLVPRVGGDLYADKPPFYFWLLTLAIGATGSVRAGFLLPSLLAGLGTVLLVYDLLRRVYDREVGLAGALLLLCTFQFVWQARQAQIDATLCFLTTLGLYGLLRYLLQQRSMRWWLVGWAAAGLGIITKGVGFLPLLVLLPWVWLARVAGR
jgi:4-amino-4-deoxy-L-arabinose transferase-like glycosyltransferase